MKNKKNVGFSLIELLIVTNPNLRKMVKNADFTIDFNGYR